MTLDEAKQFAREQFRKSMIDNGQNAAFVEQCMEWFDVVWWPEQMDLVRAQAEAAFKAPTLH